MHSLLILSILDNSVMVLAFDALEASLVAEMTENVPDLILCEVVGTSLIVANIKVLAKLRDLFGGKSELG